MRSSALIPRPEMGPSLLRALGPCPAAGPGCGGHSPSCSPLWPGDVPTHPCVPTQALTHLHLSGLGLPIWTMGLQPSEHPCPLTGGVHELLRYCAGLHTHGRLRGPGEPSILGARRPEEPLAVRQLQGDGGWLPSASNTHTHVTPCLGPASAFLWAPSLGPPPSRQQSPHWAGSSPLRDVRLLNLGRPGTCSAAVSQGTPLFSAPLENLHGGRCPSALWSPLILLSFNASY